MAEALVRVNGDETYDIVLRGLTKKDAMVVREAFSVIDRNQQWAADNQYALTQAVRNNSILTELHQEYKNTIRDPKPAEVAAPEEDPFDDTDDTDEYEDLGFER